MAASSRPSSTAGTPPLPPPELANLNFPSLSFDHGSDSDEPEEDGDNTKEVRSQPIIVQTPEARPAVVAAEIDSGSDDSSNDGDEEDVPEAPIPRDVTAGGVDNGSAGSAAIDKEENANKPQPVGYAAALLRSPGSSGLPPPVPPSTKPLPNQPKQPTTQQQQKNIEKLTSGVLKIGVVNPSPSKGSVASVNGTAATDESSACDKSSVSSSAESLCYSSCEAAPAAPPASAWGAAGGRSFADVLKR
jgi:hypothetical protein